MTPRCSLAAVSATILASAAAAQTAFLGPTPYLSKADSPFDLNDLGYTFVLEDFEDGTLDLPGVFLSVGSVKGPGPTTDSVDADDGAIDGVGTNGHSWGAPAGSVLFIGFDDVALGGLPTHVGFVWTDGGPNAGVTIVALGPNGSFLGQFLPTLGDAFDGTVGDDRFIGITNPGGISAITISNVLGALEIDHIQFELPIPSQAAFIPARPYTSIADSPCGIVTPGVDHGLVDFESGDMLAYGATISANYFVPPSSFTDSVDFDDGALDGHGVGGHSVAQVTGVPLVVTFDAARLGGLPKHVGAVVTDISPGPHHVRMQAFGDNNTVLGDHTYVIVGDDNGNGDTAEDRFIGLDALVGVTRVEITGIDSNIEVDHIQYDIPTPPTGSLDPVPYTSTADSPFGIVTRGVDHEVVDFEDGTANAYGATIDVEFIIPPSPGTDSVDADDGVIDGSGSGGWSAAAIMGSPITVEFDSAVLGGLPKQFGVVVTDLGEGPHAVLLRLFDADNAMIATRTYTISGDDSADGTTAEDRFIGATTTVGIARAVFIPLNTNIEFDHVQYQIPTPPALTYLPATPYLKLADSPFNIQEPGVDFGVIDFEDGAADPYGAALTISYIVDPGPVTDSVDADDGVVDGSGNGGHSGAEVTGVPIKVTFDADLLGALPTKFGAVITDIATGPHGVILRAYDANNALLGTKTFTIVGDGSATGETAEDRFIGFTSAVGVARAEIVAVDSNIEIDHVQYNITTPSALTFLAPTPYVKVADSPLGITNPGTDFVVIDFETTDAPLGGDLTISYIIDPSPFTDSVDADDGVVDGNGASGHSGAELAGIPIVVVFDGAALGGLPTKVGAVVTDIASGPHKVKMRAFGENDAILGSKTYTIVGDDSFGGTTAEDRFIGFTSTAGVARLEIVPIDSNIEIDHIQYNITPPPPPENPADLNTDGVVDGADLAIVLANWGGAGVGDINDDGIIDGADLASVLAAWTAM
ncbi:MAG: hypothetical protein U0575_16065 [Phycisphaerales bacterium]